MKTSHLIRKAKAITALGRHSIKGNTPSGLAPEGEGKAQWAGRNLPKGFMVFARAGDQERHGTTAKIMLESFPGKKEARVEKEPLLGLWCTKKPKVMEALAKEKGWEAVFGDWIDGKIPESVVVPAIPVGETVLKRAIGQTRAILQSTSERPFCLNVTSSGMEAAILKALGIDFRRIKPKKPRARTPPKAGETLKETEAMLFFHLPDGKIILAFRGRKFDVTKQVKGILEKNERNILK